MVGGGEQWSQCAEGKAGSRPSRRHPSCHQVCSLGFVEAL
jgi:hypothetical protein